MKNKLMILVRLISIVFVLICISGSYVIAKDYNKVAVIQSAPAEVGWRADSGSYNTYFDFETPIPADELAGEPIVKVVSRTDGSEIACETLPEFEIKFSDIETESGFKSCAVGIDIICAGSGLPGSGEYNLYVYYENYEIGPVMFNYYDYNVSTMHWSAFCDKMRVSYLFNHPDDKYIVSANIKITSESGIEIINSVTAPDEYRPYNMATMFNFDMPNLPDESVYMLSTVFNYNDGSMQILPDRHILIENAYFVSYIHSERLFLTPVSKRLELSVEFNQEINDPDDLYITLKDPDGVEIGRSSEWYYKKYDVAEVMYIVDINADLSTYEEGSEFVYELHTRGSVPLLYTKTYTIELFDYPIVLGSKRTGKDTFELVTENLASGVYPIYPNSEIDYYTTGTLTVNGDGSAKVSEHPTSNGVMWIDVDTENGPERCWLDLVIDSEVLPYIETNPKTARANVNEYKDISVEITDKSPITAEDIVAVDLCFDGRIISRGENIRTNGGYIKHHDFRNNQYYTNEVLVDFPAVDTSGIADDISYPDNMIYIRVITKYWERRCDYLILDDNVPFDSRYFYSEDYCGRIHIVNYDNYSPADELAFVIDNTNFTEGNVVLEENVYDGGINYKKVASIPLSELTRYDGNLYSYSGSFKGVAEAGKEYTLTYENSEIRNPEEAVNGVYFWGTPLITDEKMLKPDIDIYQNYYLKSSSFVLYGGALNVDLEDDIITAYSENEDGSITDIPVICKNVTHNYYGVDIEDKSYTEFSFDFSNVPSFDKRAVCICLNGEIQCSFSIWDSRLKKSVISSSVGVHDERQTVDIEGTNLSGTELMLKIWKIEEHNLNEVFSKDFVKEFKARPDNDNEYSFYIDELDLPEGKYAYNVFINGMSVEKELEYGGFVFYVGKSALDSGIPILVAQKYVSGSEMNVDLINLSDSDITADVIVSAYDEEGGLLDVRTAADVTVPANGELDDIKVPIISGAAEYKALVWDDLEGIKPMSKID